MAGITKEKLLAVEGKDEVEFFKAFLRHICRIDEFEIRDVSGQHGFHKKFPGLGIVTK